MSAPGARYSLRTRLTVSIVVVLAVVLGGFGLVLEVTSERALWRALDARLDTEARALTKIVEEKRTGFVFEWEGIAGLPEFRDPKSGAYFQVWYPDGKVMMRSPSLGTLDLLAPGPISLPDGRPGRAAFATEPAHWVNKLPQPPDDQRLRIRAAVARATEAEDAALRRLWNLFLGFTALAVLVAGGAGAVMVSRGLRPALALASTLDSVEASHLGRRIVVPGLPRELEPPVAKLNELMARLDESFGRERRFTADASHELRTPLAGLRALLEVAASRERSGEEYRAVIAEAMNIVRQMHALAEDLLMLARLDSQQIEVVETPIALRSFVDEAWRPLAEQAQQRRLTFENAIAPRDTLVSDPDKLRLVLRNLLSNAAAYTEAGGRIEVKRGDGVVFEVWDSGPAIPPEVMPRLFERFFRGDAARSGGGAHCGIGLALVQAVCGPMGLTVTAANPPSGGVCFRVEPQPR
jgi:signal transduction histidine kinase